MYVLFSAWIWSNTGAPPFLSDVMTFLYFNWRVQISITFNIPDGSLSALSSGIGWYKTALKGWTHLVRIVLFFVFAFHIRYGCALVFTYTFGDFINSPHFSFSSCFRLVYLLLNKSCPFLLGQMACIVLFGNV